MMSHDWLDDEKLEEAEILDDPKEQSMYERSPSSRSFSSPESGFSSSLESRLPLTSTPLKLFHRFVRWASEGRLEDDHLDDLHDLLKGIALKDPHPRLTLYELAQDLCQSVEQETYRSSGYYALHVQQFAQKTLHKNHSLCVTCQTFLKLVLSELKVGMIK